VGQACITTSLECVPLCRHLAKLVCLDLATPLSMFRFFAYFDFLSFCGEVSAICESRVVFGASCTQPDNGYDDPCGLGFFCRALVDGGAKTCLNASYALHEIYHVYEPVESGCENMYNCVGGLYCNRTAGGSGSAQCVATACPADTPGNKTVCVGNSAKLECTVQVAASCTLSNYATAFTACAIDPLSKACYDASMVVASCNAVLYDPNLYLSASRTGCVTQNAAYFQALFATASSSSANPVTVNVSTIVSKSDAQQTLMSVWVMFASFLGLVLLY